MPEASADAIVTDPPYGLEFMGQAWDHLDSDLPQAGVWKGRRGKGGSMLDTRADNKRPGGARVAFGAGKQYGFARCRLCGKRQFSGSPCQCPEPEWVIEHRQGAPSSSIRMQRWHEAWAREAWRVLKPGAHLVAFGGTRTFHRLACALEDAGFEVRDCLMWLYGSGFPKSLDVGKALDREAGAEREVVGHRRGQGAIPNDRGQWGLKPNEPVEVTLPATEAARQWDGWGTALKPAWEPILLARRPLTGTVAENVRVHGTGALNIDGCRIGTEKAWPATRRWAPGQMAGGLGALGGETGEAPCDGLGRWPANLILDPEAAAMLDVEGGDRRNPGSPGVRDTYGSRGVTGWADGKPQGPLYFDTGGASRFFYTSKASRADRDGSRHPTVKPTDLCQWLVRLVTPAGGLVIDPFCGSGPIVWAAREMGHEAIGIDREATYLDEAWHRLRQGLL